MKIKRYYLCCFPEKRAISYDAIPETWGNITGMLDLDNATLADLTWAGYPGYGFVEDDSENLKLIPTENLIAARGVAAQIAIEDMRVERDKRLATSDSAMLIDRWTKYTPEHQAALTTYRQTLRDMPVKVETPFDFEWPAPPV